MYIYGCKYRKESKTYVYCSRLRRATKKKNERNVIAVS